MTYEQALETAIISGFVVGGRILSHFEHKKTGKDVAEIKIYINGELEKKLEQARQEGRDEEKLKK